MRKGKQTSVVVIAYSFIALIIVSITLQLVYIHKITNEMSDIIISVETGAKEGNHEAVKLSLNEFENYWRKHKGFLEVIVSHSHTHNIDKNLLTAKDMLKYDNIEILFEAISEIKYAIKNIFDEDCVSLNNIL